MYIMYTNASSAIFINSYLLDELNINYFYE